VNLYKTRENAIVEFPEYQIPVTQLVWMQMFQSVGVTGSVALSRFWKID